MAPDPEPADSTTREIRTELGHLSGVVRTELIRLGRQISSEIEQATKCLTDVIETQHRRSIGRLLVVNVGVLVICLVVLAVVAPLLAR